MRQYTTRVGVAGALVSQIGDATRHTCRPGLKAPGRARPHRAHGAQSYNQRGRCAVTYAAKQRISLEKEKQFSKNKATHPRQRRWRAPFFKLGQAPNPRNGAILRFAGRRLTTRPFFSRNAHPTAGCVWELVAHQMSPLHQRRLYIACGRRHFGGAQSAVFFFFLGRPTTFSNWGCTRFPRCFTRPTAGSSRSC